MSVYILFTKSGGGVSSARNEGLKIAKGNYVIFADSDDKLGENYLASLMEDPEDRDLVVGGYRMVKNVDESPVYQCDIPKHETLEIGYECLERLMSLRIYAFVWAKRFSRKILHENQILFFEDFHYGEDAVFVAQYLGYCKKISIVPENDYFYYKYEERRLTSDIELYRPEQFFNESRIVQTDFLHKICTDEKLDRRIWEGHFKSVWYKFNDLAKEDEFSMCAKIKALNGLAKHRMFEIILENAEKYLTGEYVRLLKICKTKKGWIIYAYIKMTEMKGRLHSLRR